MDDAHNPFGSSEAQRAVRELPFVEETAPGEIDFWSVEGVGDSTAADIGIGETCAGLALAAARRFEMPVLVAMILRDMVRGGRFTGVEAGFIASIASAARVGSNH